MTQILEARDKIKGWILEENKLELIDDGESELNAFGFLIKTKDSKQIPIQILGSKTNNKRICVCWVWNMPKRDVPTIREVIKDDVKTKCKYEIDIGLSLMNLPVKFDPSIQKLEKITVEKFIHLDGLTKDRLYDVVNLLLRAYVFTARKLVEHFKIPKNDERFTGV